MIPWSPSQYGISGYQSRQTTPIGRDRASYRIGYPVRCIAAPATIASTLLLQLLNRFEQMFTKDLSALGRIELIPIQLSDVKHIDHLV